MKRLTLHFFPLLTLLLILALIVTTPSSAYGATLYWYKTGTDSNWSTLTGNWWTNATHTSQAGSLPTSTDSVVTLGSIAPFINLDTWTAPTSIIATSTGIIATSSTSYYYSASTTGDVTLNGGGFLGGVIYGNVTLNHTAGTAITATIYGNATFNDATQNTGLIVGTTTFNGTSRNLSGLTPGRITGYVFFNDSTSNAGIITGDATFNSTVFGPGTTTGNVIISNATSSRVYITGTSIWGTVGGTVRDGSGNTITDYIFTDSSHNYGTINGNATFYNSSMNGYSGFLPNATYSKRINGNATFYNTAQNRGPVTGNATFYDTSSNRSTISGNGTFYEDGTENLNTVSGTKTRIYTSNATSSRNFTTDSPWTVIASGATVNLSSATFDNTTTFSITNNGAFVGIPDTFAPQISSVATSTTGTTLSVSWTTNESATSTIYYGLTTLYGNSVSSNTFTTSHSYTITDLIPSTNYHFIIYTSDASGNTATSSDYFVSMPNQTSNSSGSTGVSGGGGGGGGSSGGSNNGSGLIIIYGNPASNNVVGNNSNNTQVITGDGVVVQNDGRLTPTVITHIPQYFTFTRNATINTINIQVRTLQKFLNDNGFPVSKTGLGAPGNESSYFGLKTRIALARFQRANGIRPANGFFGPITRAYINKLISTK